MTILIGSTQAFKGSTISLDHPWLIDLSHLLLVVSASSNVVVYAVQVLLSLLPEMEKAADAADMSVLFFLAGAYL